MSDHFETFVPIAVLTASFLGSSHCVIMCGAITSAVNKTTIQSILYQIGRLWSYLFLGFLFGFLGEVFLKGRVTAYLSLFSASLMAILFLLLAFQAWKGTVHFPLPKLLRRLSVAISKNAAVSQKTSSFLTGILTVLLPCGWLHGFVLAAAATQSAFKGAALLGIFWLGSVPALWFSPQLFRKVVAPFRHAMPRASGLILMFVAMAVVGYRVYPALSQLRTGEEQKHHCH